MAVVHVELTQSRSPHEVHPDLHSGLGEKVTLFSLPIYLSVY